MPTNIRKLQEAIDKAAPKEALRVASHFAFKVPRIARPDLPGLDQETLMRISAADAERRVAPVITRDATLALLEETRKNARRGRWILWIAGASLVVSIAAPVLTALIT
jgi:hypothetical protein